MRRVRLLVLADLFTAGGAAACGVLWLRDLRYGRVSGSLVAAATLGLELV